MGEEITMEPCVSIGLPVYNGENYLKESIASILSQTFGNFELIISDNASEDQTKEIYNLQFGVRRPRASTGYPSFDAACFLLAQFNGLFGLYHFSVLCHFHHLLKGGFRRCLKVIIRF